MAIQTVRPKTQREFMSKISTPYDPKYGGPEVPFSEEYKAGQPENNRALEVSLKDDEDKDISIGIKDINEAVNHYFTNILRLHVVQNNTRVNVPVIYGSSETWKLAQHDGYYRDGAAKLMAPLLMFKRNTITQNNSLTNKLDGNITRNLQLFEKTFSRRNVYSNFTVLNNRSAEKEYVATVVPDYVTVSYSCVVWTHFMEQMDKLIESLNYASKSYWGDPNRYQFYTTIDSFSESATIETGEDRVIKNTFDLTLNGYLIPETMNRALSATNRVYGTCNIVFGLETADSTETFVAKQRSQPNKKLSNTVVVDSVNKVINQITNNVSPESITYLNTNKQLTGIVTDSVTVTFPAGWLVAPTGLPATSIDNFTFFCNGQFIEKTAIVSFTQAAGVSTLVINPSELSYSLETDDEVVGIGKFNG